VAGFGFCGRDVRDGIEKGQRIARTMLNRSIHSRVACSTASKLRRGPRRRMTSALSPLQGAEKAIRLLACRVGSRRAGHRPGLLAPGWRGFSAALWQGQWPLPGCARRAQAQEVPAFRSGSPCGRHFLSMLLNVHRSKMCLRCRVAVPPLIEVQKDRCLAGSLQITARTTPSGCDWPGQVQQGEGHRPSLAS